MHGLLISVSSSQTGHVRSVRSTQLGQKEPKTPQRRLKKKQVRQVWAGTPGAVRLCPGTLLTPQAVDGEALKLCEGDALGGGLLVELQAVWVRVPPVPSQPRVPLPSPAAELHPLRPASLRDTHGRSATGQGRKWGLGRGPQALTGTENRVLGPAPCPSVPPPPRSRPRRHFAPPPRTWSRSGPAALRLPAHRPPRPLPSRPVRSCPHSRWRPRLQPL